MAEPLKMEEKGAPPIITQDLGVRREYMGFQQPSVYK